MRGFSYLGDRVNAGSGCKAAVTTRGRIGWVKFRECRELLNSKRFSLKLKGMVYRSCVRSAMLYESETRCLREIEMAILRRTKRAINVWCKENRGPDGDVRIEGSSSSDGEWSEMVQAFVEEG